MRASAVVATLLAIACTPAPDTGGSTVEDTDVDLDGDGWLSPEDCDDGDAQVHPGAREHCDGVDEDCDGLVDEEATDATGFLDMDGDAFGDPDSTCCPGSDHCTEAAGDCDDAHATAYPGATEDCDQTGVDEDCDGWVDACDEDCPGPCVEVCGDGVDNDHNGRLDCEDAACMGLSACVETCGDQDDSDGDGLVGCEDWDCWGKPPCEDIVGVVTGGIAHGSWEREHIQSEGGTSGMGDSWVSSLSMSWTDVSVWLRSDPGSGWTSSSWQVPGGSLFASDSRYDWEDFFPTWATPSRPNARGLAFLPPALGRSSYRQRNLQAPMGAVWYAGAFNGDFELRTGEPFGRCRSGQAGWLYADLDQDGFGGADWRIPGCRPSREPDLVDSAYDCDDGDAGVHPRATEDCWNGLDDDCDGEVDETPTWYADQDGDGFGDAAISEQTCDPEEGWVADASDCDDQDASVYPGAEEIPDNDVYEDCWGPWVEPTVLLAGVDFEAGYRWDHIGLAPVGDVDGDGLDEVAIGTGADLVLLDYPFSSPMDRHLLDATSGSPHALGDVNGDGRADVATMDEYGRLSLYLSPLAQGMDTDIQLWDIAALTPVPDLAGDGTGDLAASHRGAVYLIDGLDLPIDGTYRPIEAVGEICIEAVPAETSSTPLAAGDTDGDGLAELLSGERVHEPTALHQTTEDAVATVPLMQSPGWSDANGDGYEDLLGWFEEDGLWYLYEGPVLGLRRLGDAAAVFTPSSQYETLELVGDLDGDGAGDLAAMDTHNLYVILFLGEFSGAMSDSEADAGTWPDLPAHSLFPVMTDLVGEVDLDGDGRDDLVGVLFPSEIYPDQAHGFVLLGADL